MKSVDAGRVPKEGAVRGRPRPRPASGREADARSEAQPSEVETELDTERCYEAIRARDARFDGRFFTGVKTTGVYCRPVCPARLPLLRNVRFFSCAAAAEAAGFRACRRCRPETAPGTPAWAGSSAVVGRALRLIEAGALDRDDVETLAGRLGLGARQLRRLFARHLGASPADVARSRRVHFARVLLDASERSITSIALDSGFASVRQFNHAFRKSFGRAPRELRRARRTEVGNGDAVTLRLRYRPPYDWQTMLGFFLGRAIPGVESVAGGRYRRTIALGADGEAAGWIEVAPLAGEAALALRVAAPAGADLLGVAERVRRIFDLGADPLAIAHALGAHADLRDVIARRPGLRVPGAWDPFELGVRAILGQQVSVKGASTLAGRIARTFGKPVAAPDGLTHLFPTAAVLADADVASIGMPRARGETIRGFAAAVARGELVLDGARPLDETVARLATLPGVGSWTAQYIALRALGEPDAFPASDLWLRRALAQDGRVPTAARAEAISERWRPWRSYAAIALWSSLAEAQG